MTVRRSPSAIVQARLGWQEYALIDASHRPAPFLLPSDLPASHGIGAVSLTGITALVGLRDIGLVRATDRILVSGAAGSVGSHVAEIAKYSGQARSLACRRRKCAGYFDDHALRPGHRLQK